MKNIQFYENFSEFSGFWNFLVLVQQKRCHPIFHHFSCHVCCNSPKSGLAQVKMTERIFRENFEKNCSWEEKYQKVLWTMEVQHKLNLVFMFDVCSEYPLTKIGRTRIAVWYWQIWRSFIAIGKSKSRGLISLHSSSCRFNN